MFNVRDYGAVGNGSADDTAALQSALTAAGAPDGGTVLIPPGTYLVSGSLSVPSRVYVQGASKGSTTLKKVSSFPLLKFWGGAGPTDHIVFGGARDLTLDGGNFAGTLLDVVYCTEMSFYNVHLFGNTDTGLETVEVWDSKFYNLSADFCGSAAVPAVWIRSSRAASGFGSSTDSTNQLQFYGLLAENWRAGGVWIEDGTGGPLIHSIYLSGLKIETGLVRGPAIKVSGTARNINIDGAYIHMHDFDSGFYAAQDAIQLYGDRDITVQKAFISNADVETIARGVDLWNAGSLINGIHGNYLTPPSIAHVNISGGGNYALEHITTDHGTLFTGNLITSPVLSSPIRSVAGIVSDASFPVPPPIGTLAVDITNNRLYVKTATTTWKSTTLI